MTLQQNRTRNSKLSNAWKIDRNYTRSTSGSYSQQSIAEA